jgi:hypothetical protein
MASRVPEGRSPKQEFFAQCPGLLLKAVREMYLKAENADFIR